MRALLAPAVAVSLVACGERPLEPREPTPGVAHFKVATFNVEIREEDHAATVEAVGATNADMIFLQEASQAWAAVLVERYASEYPYHLFLGDGTAGLGALSRWPLHEGPVHLAPNGWYPAWTLHAVTPMGEIEVLNVHLRSLSDGTGGPISDYTDWEEDHVEQLRLYLSTDAEQTSAEPAHPMLVVGDFNESPDGESLDYLESLGFTNSLPLFRPGQFTWRHPSLGSQFNEALDHIFFDDRFVPLDSRIVNAGDSDHLPVVTHLEAAPADAG